MGMNGKTFGAGAAGSPMVEKLRFRWEKGWMTREQLARYVELGAITEEEMAGITRS